MSNSPKSYRRKRILVLLATSASLVVTGVLIVPNADAGGSTAKKTSGAQGSSVPMLIMADLLLAPPHSTTTVPNASGDDSADEVPVVTTAKPATTAKPTTTKKPAASGGQGLVEKAYVTGYSWEDNTPRGSRAISNPVIHKEAAGTGTFKDPITVAVGHSINPTKMRFPEGTKFYVPEVRAYFIVEDTCGDGPAPQTKGCWTGYPAGAEYWIDLYVGNDESGNCMDKITGVHTVVRNPDDGYVVVPRKGDAGGTYSGIGNECSTYSDTPTRA